jgi:diadenosine tetraphosphate (Ap4A) HIT family hydrolase
MASDPNCPMCKTVADLEKPESPLTVWQFPHSVAVLGQWQFFTGYCVLMSRDHVTELSQLGANRTPFLDEMCLLARGIEECFRPHKLNYELLGNLVPHLHWHIFPRSANDPERLKPVWIALERADTDPAEKARLQTGTLPPAEVAKRLRDWLAANGAPTR